jgi:hypothetical protein
MTAELYPALSLWRRELRRGKRTPSVADALWRVACREAAARDAAAIGSWDTWGHYMVDARKPGVLAKPPYFA